VRLIAQGRDCDVFDPETAPCCDDDVTGGRWNLRVT